MSAFSCPVLLAPLRLLSNSFIASTNHLSSVFSSGANPVPLAHSEIALGH